MVPVRWMHSVGYLGDVVSDPGQPLFHVQPIKEDLLGYCPLDVKTLKLIQSLLGLFINDFTLHNSRGLRYFVAPF